MCTYVPVVVERGPDAMFGHEQIFFILERWDRLEFRAAIGVSGVRCPIRGRELGA